MTTHPTFHAGEIALQSGAGVAEQLADMGPRIIRGFMPRQHREFFGQLPFLVLGALDASGQPWATVLAGTPGFVHSPHERELAVEALPASCDPLYGHLHVGAPVGMLGIEAQTRRRNRLNGSITLVDDTGFRVEVGQSYGNCPKYIQARRAEYAADARPSGRVVDSAGLDDAARAIIARADTFFIATAHPDATAGLPHEGVDVSHRGGRPGFIEVSGNSLAIPDFIGNSFFNTLGNLALNPRCGLVFVNFDTGGLLYVAAHAQIVSGGPQVDAVPGAQRLLRMQVISVRHVESALPLRWGPAELSPYLPAAAGHAITPRSAQPPRAAG